MGGDRACTEDEALSLLDELSAILENDPLIDELGFIHPSQLSLLNEEEEAASGPSELKVLSNKSDVFWCRDHKLGISTQYLLLLYNAAKRRFMDYLSKYKMSTDLSEKNELGDELARLSFCGIESELMKHSKLLLLLCGDFATAWNARKSVVSKKSHPTILTEELQLSALVLSFAAKTEQAWNHRRWVIKIMAAKGSNLSEIMEKESELVENLAEKSKMNYRAWNHRSWVVSYMSGQQVLDELKKSKKWAGLHIADNSCFHYRRRLMLRMIDVMKLETSTGPCTLPKQLWKEELDWSEMLIRRYIGREALWLHRRFLSHCWMKHILSDSWSSSEYYDKSDIENHPVHFMEKELCLIRDSLNTPEDGFQDASAQAVYAVSYILWLNKQVLQKDGIVLDGLKAEDLRTLLCTERPEKTQLWEILLG